MQPLRNQGVKAQGFARKIDEARAQMLDVEWITADVWSVDSLQGIATGVDRMVIAMGSIKRIDLSPFTSLPLDCFRAS